MAWTVLCAGYGMLPATAAGAEEGGRRCPGAAGSATPPASVRAAVNMCECGVLNRGMEPGGSVERNGWRERERMEQSLGAKG